MQFCPKCGANVEGLIERCDCCGAPLVEKRRFLRCNSYLVSAAGDISDHLNALIDRGEACISDGERAALPTVAVTVYCYSPEMVQELGLREYARQSRGSGQLHLTILIDLNAYLSADRPRRREMVKASLCRRLAEISHTYKSRIPGLEEAVSKAISGMESQ